MDIWGKETYEVYDSDQKRSYEGEHIYIIYK